MKLLISTAYSSSWVPGTRTVGDHDVTISPRRCDWGKKGLLKQLHHMTEAVRVLWRARRFDALVLCTTSIEAFIVSRLRRVVCPRTRLLCFDLLIPRERRLARFVGAWLRRCDRVLVIRTGDVETLRRRFGVRVDQCTFVPFPADASITPAAAECEDDYLYASGHAHRDWSTLLAALAIVPHRAVIATSHPLIVPPAAIGRVQLLPMVSPDEGRQLMAKARVVVVPMYETELPAGPLLLLDAMAMGKAIVATRVNGTKDYARDGVNALLVDPGDATQMARAIDVIMSNSTIRLRIASAARATATQHFTYSSCMERIAAVASDLMQELSGRSPAQDDKLVGEG